MHVEDIKPAPVKPLISVMDVEKLDVRVGTILTVEDVPTSGKLVGSVSTSVITPDQSWPA
jgi:tRNA-binding EMAP/Myf-like protein